MEDIEDTQYFDENALPVVAPLDSDKRYFIDEGNESVAERGEKSNSDLPPPVHVYITEYQVQKINVNQIK